MGKQRNPRNIVTEESTAKANERHNFISHNITNTWLSDSLLASSTWFLDSISSARKNKMSLILLNQPYVPGINATLCA